MSVLRVERLGVRYDATPALKDVSFELRAGEVTALVGASGSGKSTLALAVPGLLPAEARVSGTILLDGRPIMPADRGGGIGSVFQDPATALNPALTIGRQIGEAIGRRWQPNEVAALLARVGLDVPPDRYPHMLSGGQRQRACVAIGIAGKPRLLIADEPTAALDPASAAHVATLLRGLAQADHMALLLVTHDLHLARRIADRMLVLADGRLVEQGGRSILERPRSPSLRALIAATELPQAPTIDAGSPLLELRAVTRRYRRGSNGQGGGVDRVSLTVREGETVGLIGPSGAGKSTLARLALGLDRADEGNIRLGGIDPASARGHALIALRRTGQAVFQDPATSFDPRWTVGRIVADPLRLELGANRDVRVAEALDAVELDPALAARRPAALSGGQRQRVAIARALVLAPRLVILDEALSALDLATRASIVALLQRLQQQRGLAYLLIGHDLAVIRALAQRVAVMEAGRIVAEGPAEEILSAQQDLGGEIP